MKIGELFMDLGFKADTMKLNDFIKSISDLKMSSLLAGTSYAALASLMQKSFDETSDLTKSMRLFNVETGLSSQKMEQWSMYAERLGMSKDGVKQALTAFNESINQAKMGNISQGMMSAISMLNTYGKAGIDPMKLFAKNSDIYSIFDQLGEGFKKVDPRMRGTIAGMAGLSGEMLNILMISKEQRAIRDSIPVPSDKDVSSMMNFRAQWTELNQEIATAGRRLSADIAPALLEILRLVDKILDSGFMRMMGRGISNAGRIIDIGSTWYDVGKMNVDALSAKNQPVNAMLMQKRDEYNAEQGARVSAVFHINGNDTQAMKKAAKDAFTEAVAEAYHARHKGGN